MPFSIIRNDITKMHVDAIINAANTSLQMGGGVCGAIFKAAGAKKLQAACDKLAPIDTGEAVITPGFSLPAKYIIHTVGPIYHQWSPAQSGQLLRSSYANALKRAVENQCESIAFPLISSGIYGYPKAEALQVASSAMQDFLKDHDLNISLVVFDKASFIISEKLLGDITSYIDEHYVVEHRDRRRNLLLEELQAAENLQSKMPDAALKYDKANAIPVPTSTSIDELLGNLDEPFSQSLLRLIDAKGKTDVDVYKRANLDRKLFSKIRIGKGYIPGKRTIIALAIALELSLDETDQLLERAGYTLSHSQKFDVIIEYFIVNNIFDVFQINEVLFQYDQPLLGG